MNIQTTQPTLAQRLAIHRNSLRCFVSTYSIREGRAAAQALASLPQIFGLAGEGAL